MEKEMLYGEIEMALDIFSKIATREVIPRWEIARRKRVLSEVYAPVEEAKETPQEMQEYNSKKIKLYRREAVDLGNGAFKVPPESVKPLKDGLNELEIEFSDVIDNEDKRLAGIAELMKKSVKVNIEPLEYEWIGDYLDANDVERLMALDMILPPKSEKEDKDKK